MFCLSAAVLKFGDQRIAGKLISLAKRCDDGCIAIFNKHDVKIAEDNKIVIEGSRMPNGSWSLPLLDSAPHQANGTLRTNKPKQELAKCLHAALGSTQQHLPRFPLSCL
jgi:hypothetical protein